MKTKSLLVTLLTLASSLQSVDLDMTLSNEIRNLTILLRRLTKAESYSEKIALLDEVPEVEKFFSQPSILRTFLAGLSEDCEYVIKSTFAIHQGKRIFDVPLTIFDPVPYYRRLLDDLLAIDSFYQNIGGIVGYQCLVLSFLVRNDKEAHNVFFKPPKGIDLSNKNSTEVHRAILEGIRNQKNTAEFYPVGGSADRLSLKDGRTGKDLPAACLVFQGKNLLEGMIHDLQAREYLYYKLFDEQIITPIALMTSKVNYNHSHIQEIFMKNKWFGRPYDSFRLFTQPSVPVFTQKGEWCLENPLTLLLRPGGHGVIWKLAEEQGVFDWIQSKGKEKALVRQVNNPMASIDYGLIAFLGIGHLQNKAFGFASCERRVNAQEGMIVLKEIETSEERLAVVTNVEYCDFEKYGIEDKPKSEGSSFSLFPSNTNILFIDLKSIRKSIQTLSLPGLLVNFREGVHYTPEGLKKEKVARLETTMQNIADVFIVPVEEQETLPTYVTFNKRKKTISTTKRKTAPDGQLFETPEGCFYDLMQNMKELLSEECQMNLGSVNGESKFLREGPAFLMSYHPALGPLYSVIGQKIQGGEIFAGSELQLEIADLEIKNLSLDGSLRIFADNVMGHKDDLGNLHYSNQTGQCLLGNVRVENAGIDWGEKDYLFWKHEVNRKASLTIQLKGHSRFEAKNVTFKEGLTIEIPDGVHMTVTQKNGKLNFEKQPLVSKKPFWSYLINTDDSIAIVR